MHCQPWHLVVAFGAAPVRNLAYRLYAPFLLVLFFSSLEYDFDTPTPGFIFMCCCSIINNTITTF